MKRVKVLILASVMGFYVPTFAQVAINADATAPNGAAMLDVSSTSKGMLIPRMNKAARDVIGSPVAGLMIYQTDNTPGFYFHNGSAWKLIGSEAFSINDLSDGKTSVSSVFLGSGSGNVDNGGSTNYNTAIGVYSLYKVTNGIENTAVGFKSLYNNIGQINTSVGYLSMESNTSGSENTAIGAFALNKNLTGSKNTAFGVESLFSNNNVDAINNVALGYKSLRSNTSGANNTACGESALFTNSSGGSNTAIGSTALFYNTTGNQNFAAGLGAATNNNSGNNNIVIGYNANYFNQTGSYNTIIGSEAGKGSSNHNKSGNVFLGYQAGFSETGSNKLYIENSNSTTPLIYGEFNNNLVTIYGNLGMGTTAFGGGSNTFALFNGTVPASSITDGILLYSEDVSAFSELKVRDEAGNVTTLSPHNFSMTDKSEPMAWSYYSENHAIGEKINVDMLKAIRLIEEITGEKLVTINKLDEQTQESSVVEQSIGIIQLQQKLIDELLIRVEKLEKEK